MPIPFLFIGIAAVTGATGAGKTVKAGVDQSRAKKINANANATAKYYAESVLEVYKIALNGRVPGSKRGFFSKARDIIKRGFNGK